jgi:hypothetical protein
MAKRGESPALLNQFSDWRWRLNNLYWIVDKEGHRVQFELNWAQENLFDEMHFMNCILKARQLGFTTFIQIFMLDACIFNANIRAGTIAHRLDDAKTIFRDKIKYPYDNLPDGLKNRVRKVSDSADELLLSNNSSIRVGTSLRSGTLQYLHISEYGKLCAQFPEKAREVRTGALNTVQAGQVVFIESTAEGQEGHFFDLCENARSKARMQTTLTPLDFKFHFYPWHRNPDYVLAGAVVIGDDLRRYFEKLASGGIILSPGQQAWYAKKTETQLADMKREYPSTPEEAFEASVEGAYYANEMAIVEMQERIGAFKAIPGLPVNTAFDIGRRDPTSIWFWQQHAGKIGIVGYYHASGEGLPFYLDRLREYRDRLGWVYGTHLWPHDGKVNEWGSGRSRIEVMEAAIREGGLGETLRVLPNNPVDDGINAARMTIPLCHFDAAECSEGIKSLKAYRKDWDENRATWKDSPRHDWASHGADAFRTLAMGWRETSPELVRPQTPQEMIAEMIKPRSLDAMLAEYDLEQADREQEGILQL